MPFWYAAKVMEVITLHLFTNISTHDNNIFKGQAKSTNQRLITLAIDWLHQHLDEALNLKDLSQHLGCSSQYISRIFSENTGKTLTLSLRSIRINKAAELLNSGDYNVTEAAMEVGYSSLSHFTKVFISEKGVKPSQFI
ncbi:MAG: helix-turn-helix domain-containing protein [Akkermansiaceae bacterium]